MWKRYVLFGGLAAVVVPLAVLMLRGGAAEPATTPRRPTAGSFTVTVYPNERPGDARGRCAGRPGIVDWSSRRCRQTVNSSLYSEGGEGVRVLTTRFRTRPIKENTARRGPQAGGRDSQAPADLRTQPGRSCHTLEQNLKMLAKLEDFTSVTTKSATEKASLNSESCIALAKYVMDTRGEKTKELVGLKQQWQTANEQMEFARRQMAELSAGTARVERDAVIIVDKGNRPAPARFV